MRIGVTHKLFLAILMAAGLAVTSSALIMQWSLDRGFLKFVNTTEKSGISRLATKLEGRYRIEQSWEFIRREPAQWRRLVAESLPETTRPPGEKTPDGPPPEHDGAHKPRPLSPHMIRHFDQRLFLLDADKKVLLSRVPKPIDNSATPLTCQGRVVGYLGLLPRTKLSDAPQQRFLKEQKWTFALIAGVLVLLSAALALLLARRLVRPLSELEEATHQLAAGKFTVRVPVTSDDELGKLANDFNLLALALEKSELNRRQWVADISHELRTPLAVLRGEIEALQDSIRQPNRETLHSLHGEVLRLARLVDDLFQLSLSDVGALTYRKERLDLADLLRDSVAGYRSEFAAKGINLELAIDEKTPPIVFGDGERLQQLLANLLHNSLTYTDPNGRLQVALQQFGTSVLLHFRDSPPGVPPSELERLFERLYRVESSRNRGTGGAGLGLAICRNIVEAHGGNISAYSSELGGVGIRVELPKAGA